MKKSNQFTPRPRKKKLPHQTNPKPRKRLFKAGTGLLRRKLPKRELLLVGVGPPGN